MTFADFLAAKFGLDERSLNPAVNATLLQQVVAMPALQVLDVGAGAGASIARIQRWRPSGCWSLTALDRDEDLLRLARMAALSQLPGSAAGPGDSVRSAEAGIAVDFAACELREFRPRGRYDLVLAHAFLDLVPLEPALAAIARCLRPGGLLYATINCDGAPEIAPPYEDTAFEAALLAVYAQSMDARRVDGLATGGACCGRQLIARLPEQNYRVLACGSSDWHMVPRAETYPDRDRECLQVLLELLWQEGRKSERLSLPALRHWHEQRLRLLQACRLEMRVPNVDLLARYTGGVQH
jgi:SAM-dependent methyltransferase